MSGFSHQAVSSSNLYLLPGSLSWAFGEGFWESIWSGFRTGQDRVYNLLRVSSQAQLGAFLKFVVRMSLRGVKNSPGGRKGECTGAPRLSCFLSKCPASWFSRSPKLYIPHGWWGLQMQAGEWSAALWELHVGKVTSDGAEEGACLSGWGGLGPALETLPVWMKESGGGQPLPHREAG